MIKNPISLRNISHPALVVSLFAILSLPVAHAQSVSQEIDRLVEAGYKEHKIKPNAPTTDDVFVRRAYLDIIGRVPTLGEISEFQTAEGNAKRAKLVNKLMDSEGFVSHFYNYWADVLRIKSRIEGEAGAAYANWVKEAVRTNKPYNEFVGELITADGYVWDNGAVGYYMRDAGMPLDNMAHTAQIFLGTRMVCAQCHDHPFDKWDPDGLLQDGRLHLRRLHPDPSRRHRRDRQAPEAEKYKGMDRNVRRALNDILEPLSYGVRDTTKEIKLPDDYKYEDAKPKEVIKPGHSVRREGAQKEAGSAAPLRRVDDRFRESALHHRDR